MATEATFHLPFEIPRNTRQKNELKFYLEALNLPPMGDDRQAVGVGFVWHTRTSLGNGGHAAVTSLGKRLVRALYMTGVLSRRSEPYNLEQRIVYIRGGDPYAEVILKEE